jgi:hypothetical protein
VLEPPLMPLAPAPIALNSEVLGAEWQGMATQLATDPAASRLNMGPAMRWQCVRAAIKKIPEPQSE